MNTRGAETMIASKIESKGNKKWKRKGGKKYEHRICKRPTQSREQNEDTHQSSN